MDSLKWIVLLVGIVAVIVAYVGNSKRKNNMAMGGSLVALVCVVIFFLFQFGMFEEKTKDVIERESNPLGVGILKIFRKNELPPVEQMAFIMEKEDEITAAMKKTLEEGSYMDIEYFVMNEDYDSFDEYVSDVVYNGLPGRIVLIRGKMTSNDVFEDTGCKVIYIGNPPSGMKGLMAVVTPSGTETAISKTPQKDFTKNYSVEEF